MMATRVQIKNRRSSLSDKVNREVMETVVLRDGEVVAVLSEGDPLGYTLQLSADQLGSLKKGLGNVLNARPQLRRLLEALIEHKRAVGQTQPSLEGPAAYQKGG
jgi:hypothetical protein